MYRADKRREPWRLRRERSTRRWTDHAAQALLAEADQTTKSPFDHFQAKPDRACKHRNNHTDHHMHAEELATLLLTTMLLQPPYPPVQICSADRPT